MGILSQLDPQLIRDHYEGRVEMSQNLKRLFQDEKMEEYVYAALGVEPRGTGNYSADAHGLGPMIVDSMTSLSEVVALARALDACTNPEEIPSIVCERNRVAYLAISVGSEMAMMLHPDRFWVVNAKTVWAHLWVQEGFDTIEANKRAEGWRTGSSGPEVRYELWNSEYCNLEPSLRQIAEIGSKELSVQPGANIFLWADAIAAFACDQK